MAAAVDEEGRRAGDAAEVGAVDVLGDARRRRRACAGRSSKRSTSRPSSLGVADEVAGGARPGGSSSRSCISQNAPCSAAASAASAASCAPGVDVVQRQVPPDVAQRRRSRRSSSRIDRLGLPAVGALEVAVLDERHRRVLGAADVVALGVDRHGEIDDHLGACRAAPAPAAACGRQRRRPEDEPGRATRARARR